jgi:prepilin-type processing-associated H-X9-DG protein
MKAPPNRMEDRAFTRLELIMVIVSVAGIALVVLPARERARVDSVRRHCANNLNQVGLAFHLWAMDNNDRFPMQVSTNKGGTMELAAGTNVFLHFQVMSNELNTPKILACPDETNRRPATNFLADFNDSRIGDFNENRVSYFVGLDTCMTNGTMFLSGDHHLTAGAAFGRGVTIFTNNQPVHWTKEMHDGTGNIVLVDGSVHQAQTRALRRMLASTGVTTNRLAFP